jgi:hypothetical protein
MKRTTINYSIDVLILIFVFLCNVTGIVKWPGLIPNMGLTSSKMPMAAITAVHDWSRTSCMHTGCHSYLSALEMACHHHTTDHPTTKRKRCIGWFSVS